MSVGKAEVTNMEREIKTRRRTVEEAGKWLLIDSGILFRIVGVAEDVDNYVTVHYMFAGMLGNVLIYTDEEKFIVFKNDDELEVKADNFFYEIALAFCEELGMEDVDIDTTPLASYVYYKIIKRM